MQATVAQMTFEMLSAMPTIAEMDREIAATDAVIAEIKATSDAEALRQRDFDSRMLWSIVGLGYGAMQGKLTVDHVVGMTGVHLYWTVKTADSTKTVYSKLELFNVLGDCGAQFFGKCAVMVPSSEGTQAMALDTDDLVKDVDPDDTSDLQLDELAEAID